MMHIVKHQGLRFSCENPDEHKTPMSRHRHTVPSYAMYLSNAIELSIIDRVVSDRGDRTLLELFKLAVAPRARIFFPASAQSIEQYIKKHSLSFSILEYSGRATTALGVRFLSSSGAKRTRVEAAAT